MILSTLGRLFWVPIAFVMTAIGTAFFLVMIAKERVFDAMAGRGPDSGSLIGILDLMMQGQMLLSGLTVIPAVLVVIVGEVARIRSSLYYIVAAPTEIREKPNVASRMIASPVASIPATRTGASALGIRWRSRIWLCEAPRLRAAST